MTMELTSHITFLYFDHLDSAKEFFEHTLGLKTVYDPGWAIVYRLSAHSFLGAVDAATGSIAIRSRGGVLVSFTVRNVEAVHQHFSELGLNVSPIKMVKDLELKSFFFTGPEGYEFEVQQFTSPELRELF